jgi:hypothetical protein
MCLTSFVVISSCAQKRRGRGTFWVTRPRKKDARILLGAGWARILKRRVRLGLAVTAIGAQIGKRRAGPLDLFVFAPHTVRQSGHGNHSSKNNGRKGNDVPDGRQGRGLERTSSSHHQGAAAHWTEAAAPDRKCDDKGRRNNSDALS